MHQLLMIGANSSPQSLLRIIKLHQLVVDLRFIFHWHHLNHLLLHESLSSGLSLGWGSNALNVYVKKAKDGKDLHPSAVTERVELGVHHLRLGQHVTAPSVSLDILN